MKKIKQEIIDKIPLGKKVSQQQYSEQILVPIPRTILNNSVIGEDIWNCYECYWLNSQRVPQVHHCQIRYCARSEFIVESKSLKLYLNSYHNLVFESNRLAQDQIQKDLTKTLKTEVTVQLSSIDTNVKSMNTNFINIDSQIPGEKKGQLLFEDSFASEVLYSHLYRSLCPVTSQPDFATIIVKYTGKKINQSSLLSVILDRSNHEGFHEECIEILINEILSYKCVEKLSVQGLFTRRGGIDINPFRSTHESTTEFERHSRQ